MDSVEWNNLVKKYPPLFGAFLHSWEWGEFQKSIGREIVRVYVKNGDKELVAQAIKIDLPIGQYYWYVQKGPLGNFSSVEQINILRKKLQGGMFIRLEPNEETRLLKVKDVQPAHTIYVDLAQGEDVVLSQMKSKTRYNIRLSERKGVVSKVVTLDYFDDFKRLMNQTTKRDSFSAHPYIYYKTMLQNLQKGDVKGFLAISFFEERVIAVNIIVDFLGVRTYLHGATSNLHRNVMAQYGLHWFLMQDAIKKGLKGFDFWGVAPDDADSGHSWAGITRYKKGFGGELLSMPGTFEIPTKQLLYSGYKFLKKIRRK